MPKIIFIKNADNDIVYPYTHADAILTEDGSSFLSKVNDLITNVEDKADADHIHDYNTLTNIPSSFFANGGDADSVNGRSVDDSKTGILYLWTSQKINDEIEEIKTSISKKSYIYKGSIEPLDTELWIDTAKNVFKYKLNGAWVILGTELTFQ